MLSLSVIECSNLKAMDNLTSSFVGLSRVLEGEDILWRKTAIILKLTAKISKRQEKKSISSLLKRIGTNCESLKTSK